MRVCVRVGILLYRKTIIHDLRCGGQLRVVNRLMSQSIVSDKFTIQETFLHTTVNHPMNVAEASLMSHALQHSSVVATQARWIRRWSVTDQESHRQRLERSPPPVKGSLVARANRHHEGQRSRLTRRRRNVHRTADDVCSVDVSTLLAKMENAIIEIAMLKSTVEAQWVICGDLQSMVRSGQVT
ncbi:hypothetical protein LSAT2_005424 [Lamellibrachia satsuma]|nr:hypothetical protein LSAT2_005424 [Lamellibrachia satsuma]